MNPNLLSTIVISSIFIIALAVTCYQSIKANEYLTNDEDKKKRGKI